jgi:hypothetical protein
MFHGTYDRAERADRYRKVAAEYTGLSEATPDQFLRSFYLRIAEVLPRPIPSRNAGIGARAEHRAYQCGGRAKPPAADRRRLARKS